MPEPYATKVGSDGKTIKYQKKADYLAGVKASHMNNAKRLKKSYSI